MYEHQIIHTLFQVLKHCARYFFRLHVQFICQPEIDRRETVRTQTNARLTGTVITEPPRPVVSQLPPGKELTPDQSRIFKVQNYSPEGLFLLSRNPRAYSPTWSLLVSQIGHPTPPRNFLLGPAEVVSPELLDLRVTSRRIGAQLRWPC